MKEITIVSKKEVVLVDDEDHEELNKYKWSLITSPTSNTFYACREVNITDVLLLTGLGYPRMIVMHRQILGLLLQPYILVDHRNRNGLDNRRNNLRIATKSQNAANQAKTRSKSSSIYKGVCWSKNLNIWVAYINYQGRRRHLGIFNNEIDAAVAYNSKAKELFGEYAYLNELNLK